MVAQSAGRQAEIALFPRQQRFVRSAAPFPAYIGGIGSGKSFAGAAKVLGRLHRRELGMICAPTYPMLRDATQRTLFDLLRDAGIEFSHHKAENVVTIARTGHEILCRSLDNPDTLRGPNLDYAWIDEAAYVTAEAWRIVKGRVRVGVHPQAWITGTPKGRNWIWEEWERDATGNEFDPTHPLFRVRTEENPELPAGFVASLGYAGTFASQELGGEFVAFEGLVYPAFNRATHVRPVDTDGWGTILALDVGTRNPTALLTIRHAGDRMHVAEELYQRGMSSDDITDAAVAAYERYQPEYLVVDPSAAGLIVSLQRRNLNVRKATNDVLIGISRMTSVLNDLTVDPGCVNLIAEFESYRYPDGRRGATDAPVKEHDHAMDALRYAVMEIAAHDLTGRLFL